MRKTGMELLARESFFRPVRVSQWSQELFIWFVRIDVGQGAVGIGLFGFTPGFVEFDQAADGLLGLHVLVAQGSLQTGVSGQQRFFGLAIASEFDQARAEVAPTSKDP